MKIKTLFCIFLILSGTAFGKLDEKLKDNGGYHFRFEGTRYVLTIDVNGNIYFTSKQAEESDKKQAYSQRIRLHYRTHSKDPNDHKYWDFNKMETKIKQGRSSFTLIIQGEMENGTKTVSKLQGDRSKVILMTDMTCPDPYYFHMGFHVPEPPPELEKTGLVVKLTNQKKKITHVCSKVYEKKYYRDQCRQVLVQKRNPLSLIFDSGKAEGYFTVQQHSHNVGGVLNNPFAIYYRGLSSNVWKATKNTFIFSF
jgi:hypothetical protein